jgi:transposase
MAKEDETPRTNPAEIESLIEQIRGTNLDPRAKDKVERLLRTVLTLVELLQRKNTSIKKLREMIFGKRTERHQSRRAEGQEMAPESEKSDDGQPKAAGDQDAHAELRAIGSGDRPKRKGHGRRAASNYSGAKIVRCRHERMKAGDDCPALCGGRLYDLKEPTALMQFTGQPLITATRFEREALRCAKRQQRYVAPMRYGGGLPWHRQAGLQAMGGAPLAEATMWERCEATADAAMRVFLHLMRLAAGGEVMHTDDTWVRILSCLKEDKEEKGRATQTSGIVVKAGGRKIALYLSGRRHAGENLAELLTKREEGLARPIQMSDALAANTSVEKNVIRAYCLAHARRKVFELREDYLPNARWSWTQSARSMDTKLRRRR